MENLPRSLPPLKEEDILGKEEDTASCAASRITADKFFLLRRHIAHFSRDTWF